MRKLVGCLLCLCLLFCVGGCKETPEQSSEQVSSESSHVHTPLADDDDCTTAIECSCGEVLQEGESEHLYANDCDGDCNRAGCSVTRTPSAHSDDDEDGACDSCGYPMPFSGGGSIELPDDEF